MREDDSEEREEIGDDTRARATGRIDAAAARRTAG
jgi:hypothetical protein